MKPTIIGTMLLLSLFGCEPRGADTPENPGGPEEIAPNANATNASAGGTQTPTQPASNFKTAFDVETRDHAWASNFEGLVRVTMQRWFNDSTLQSVDCRATLCKIVVSHPNAKAQSLWARTFTYRLLHELPPSEKPVRWTKITTVSTEMDKTTLYLTRNGYAEPFADGSPRRLPPPTPGPSRPIQEP